MTENIPLIALLYVRNMPMNIFQRVLYFIPLMLTFLKGHQLFIERNFSEANRKFEKCLKHSRFHHDLLFSLYGQSLCATGRLQEGHSYLLKACESYESEGWEFKDRFALDNATNCVNALRHTCHHLNLDEGKQYFDKPLNIKSK
jgi:hypothetical protein